MTIIKVQNKEEEKVLLINLHKEGYSWLNGSIAHSWIPSINSIIFRGFPCFIQLGMDMTLSVDERYYVEE